MSQTLALYIHWPFCKAKCPYCDFNSHVRERIDEAAWRKSLLSELAYMAERSKGFRLSSIFFGGGTPSLMPPATAQALIEAALRYWDAEENLEITLEANPTSVEAGRFTDFRAAGVNRVSLGVQAMEDAALAFLGRKHSAAEALAAVELAAKHFPRYSFDLIYALPGQTAAQWEKELRRALAYAGEHLSLYQLTIEENTAFHHAYAQQAFTLPGEEQAADLYLLTQRIMEEAGLPAYEISNHARPGAESRHNLAYWKGDCYAGIGPGAHGRLRDGKENRVATQTIKSPERWLESVERQGNGVEIWQALDEATAREERLMMNLRLTAPIARAELSWLAEEKLEQCAAHGLITLTPESLQTTLQGRLLLNSLTAELAVA